LKLAVVTPPMATVSRIENHLTHAHMTLPRLLPSGVVPALVAALVALPATPTFGQTPPPARAVFDRGVVLGGEWLQATALPLDRNTLASVSFDASLRRARWAVDAGWLRIARNLSTVQGGFVSFGVPLAWGRLLAIPSIGAFGGQAQRSVDSTGFDFIGPNGVVGHTPRYSFSKSGSAGGGVGLMLEVPLYRVIAVRASASEWYFSGATLERDRARTLVGVGLSIHVNRLGGTR